MLSCIRNDNQLVFVTPVSHSNMLSIQCHFVKSTTSTPLSRLAISGNPNLVAMFSCEIPVGEIEAEVRVLKTDLSKQGDWAVSYYLTAPNGDPVTEEHTVCPLPHDEEGHYASICTTFKDEDLYFR